MAGAGGTTGAGGTRGAGGTTAGAAAPRWLDPDEMTAWLGLVELLVRLPAALDRQLREEAGIPHAHYQILAMLSAADGGTRRMSDLARLTSTSASRLSHAVAALEARGWVRRTPCEDDRRGQNAQLTAEGVAALEATAPGHVEQVRRLVFDRLDAVDVAALSALTAKLRVDPSAADPAGEPPRTARPASGEQAVRA